MNERLERPDWWYGKDCSILDVYLYWTYSTAGKGGFPLNAYLALFDHARRVQDRVSFRRAQAREAKAGLERDFARADSQFR